MRAMPAPIRPKKGLWLITFADLALLLVCFFVLLHAIDARDDVEAGKAALTDSLRAAFTAGPPAPLGLEVAAIDGFAKGSATLSRDPAAVVEWLRSATADTRAYVVVGGEADGTATDIDPEGGPLTLSARRAEAVAAAIAASGVVPPDRIRTEALGARPDGRRRVLIRISYQP